MNVSGTPSPNTPVPTHAPEPNVRQIVADIAKTLYELAEFIADIESILGMIGAQTGPTSPTPVEEFLQAQLNDVLVHVRQLTDRAARISQAL